MKIYEDLMSPENMADLREKIIRIMYEDNHTVTSLAKAIGLQHHTLNKFINQEGAVNNLTMRKIDKFVSKSLNKVFIGDEESLFAPITVYKEKE
jgi:hypothetical protein